MKKQFGFSVRIFVPSGDPEGVRVIGKSNWTGEGLDFPRSQFTEVRGREELSRAGVYVLYAPADEGPLPKVYVGEADNLRSRLSDHVRSKEFWTRGVMFTSKDQALNKAHLRHLEARLARLAAHAKRCELENVATPANPVLHEADRVDAELFLADMLLCLPVVGIRFFEAPKRPEPTAEDLTLDAKGIKAHGYEQADGFVVRANSQAVKGEVPSILGYLSELRKMLLNKGVLADKDGVYTLVQDYVFTSPSAAAGALLGRTSNGRVEWKASDGRTLKEVQEEQIPER